jgi:hypothetical protein
MACGPGGELFPGEAQARVDRVQRERERARDLGRAHLLELGEDEDLSLVVVERVEQSVNEARGFGLGRVLVRPRGDVREPLQVGPYPGLQGMRVLCAERPPISANDVYDNSEQPGLERRSTLELRKPSVNDDENLLDDIVDARFRRSESPCAPPHEGEMRFVELSERRTGFDRMARRRRVGGRRLDGVAKSGHSDDSGAVRARLPSKKAKLDPERSAGGNRGGAMYRDVRDEQRGRYDLRLEVRLLQGDEPVRAREDRDIP